MADLERTIQIIFEGDDRTRTAFGDVTTRLGAFGTLVESTADRLSGVADGVLRVDAILSALAAGGLAYAYNQSMNFETALVELQKVLGREQVDALEAARVAAFQLSDQYGVSASDVLRSTANFRQAGFEIEEAMELARNSLDLMIAGDIEAAEASGILVQALRGFREPASEATRLIDILNAVSNEYATDVQMLAEGMASLSPIARTMGFSMEETAGLLVPIIEVFQSGDEAAVALRTGLLRLVDDAAPVRAALASIGVSQTDANGALRSGRDILYDVAQAFTTLDQDQKLFVASQLVGIQQAGRMVEVFDGLARSSEITATALGSAGSAAEEVAARLASSEVHVARFIEGFRNLATIVGDQFRDAATGAVAGATEIESTLRGMVSEGTFDPIFDLLNEFSTDLGEYLRGIARALPDAFDNVDFSGFMTALRDLAGAFGAYLGDLDLTAPEDLGDAIQNVIDVITGLVRVTEGMVDAFRPFVSQVTAFLTEMSRGDENMQQFVGRILGYAEVISRAGWEIAAILMTMQETGATWGPVLSVISDSISLLWNTITISTRQAAQAFVDASIAVNAVLDTLTFGTTDYFERSNEILQNWHDRLSLAIQQDTEDWGRAFDGLTGGMLDMEGAARYSANSIDFLGSSVNAARDRLNGAAEGAHGLSDALDLMPAHKSIDFETFGIEDARGLLQQYGYDIETIPEEKITALAAATDQVSFNAVLVDIENAFPAEKNVDVTVDADAATLSEFNDFWSQLPEEKQVDVSADPNQASLDRTREQLNQVSAPRTSTVQVESDEVALERLRQQFDLIQTSVEWQAKLDIAEVEANAEIVQALADTLAAAFNSSADIISAAIGGLNDSMFDLSGNQSFLRSIIQQEMELRWRSLEATEALIATQIEFMQAKIDAMNRGDALVQIDGAGLQPHLEAFMWEVLTAIQVRVNEEGHAMLFGI